MAVNYLAYSGNDLISVRLPEGARVYHPPDPLPGIARSDVPAAVRRAFEEPLGMPPLGELVGPRSRILIVFDDNCQPFPLMRRPDFRQTAITILLEMLDSYGVERHKIQLMCAVALHRKMKPQELEYMLGRRIMREFYPERLKNFDAEDSEDIVHLGETEEGEPVETSRAVIESDLVIYVDTIQIPLNGGHKSVAVGLGTYRSIAPHHAPQMTSESPHVMQPEGSCMHASIERMSRLIQRQARIMVLEAPMNGASYPSHLRFLSKPCERCNPLERVARALAPRGTRLLSERGRRRLLRSVRAPYEPLQIRAGAIDAVHASSLEALRRQQEVRAPEQYDTMVFGLPDLSPYSIGARVNPVLVVSDVLGYVFNWFYNKPFLKKGGAVIILNPAFEVFHPEYHVAYRRFWDEVLVETHDPFEMQEHFQERFARDPELIECYRHRWAHHGFHPFTVWYWATYPLRYLSQVILVGEKESTARRLGIAFEPTLERALARAREASGGERVMAVSVPPYLYFQVEG